MVFAYEARQRFERVAVAAEIVRFERRYDHLADFFVQRQLLPGLLYPSLAGLVEMEGIAHRRCSTDDAHHESHENPSCFRAFVAILPHEQSGRHEEDEREGDLNHHQALAET